MTSKLASKIIVKHNNGFGRQIYILLEETSFTLNYCYTCSKPRLLAEKRRIPDVKKKELEMKEICKTYRFDDVTPGLAARVCSW